MKKKALAWICMVLSVFFVFAVVSYAEQDSDQDGVPDCGATNLINCDKCPNSGPGPVDQFGCTCEQRGCPSDNNPCTDDCHLSAGQTVCSFTNNNNVCPVGQCNNGVCSQTTGNNLEIPQPPYGLQFRLNDYSAAYPKARIFLKWKSAGEEKFNLYRSDNGGTFSLAGETFAINFTQEIDSPIYANSPIKKYAYYVTSLNSFSESSPSNTVQVPDEEAPAVPYDLKAVAVDSIADDQRKIGLSWSWTAGDEGSITYKIYRSVDNDPSQVIYKTQGKFYQDEGLSKYKRYKYYVTANNKFGESEKSNEAQVQATVCTSNAQCPTGQTCNTATGQCQSSGGCTSNAQCPTGQTCNTATGVCTYVSSNPVFYLSRYQALALGDHISLGVYDGIPNAKIYAFVQDSTGKNVVDNAYAGKTDENGKWSIPDYVVGNWAPGTYTIWVVLVSTVPPPPGSSTLFTKTSDTKTFTIAPPPPPLTDENTPTCSSQNPCPEGQTCNMGVCTYTSPKPVFYMSRYQGLLLGDHISLGVYDGIPNADIYVSVNDSKMNNVLDRVYAGKTDENGKWSIPDYVIGNWNPGTYGIWVVLVSTAPPPPGSARVARESDPVTFTISRPPPPLVENAKTPSFSLSKTQISIGERILAFVTDATGKSQITVDVYDSGSGNKLGSFPIGETDQNGAWSSPLDTKDWPQGNYMAQVTIAGSASNKVYFAVNP